MKLYVIRHGETDMGKNKLIATEQEPLNEKGIKQATDIGKKLRQLNIEVAYCSPIERAKDTLRLFKLDKKIPIIIDNRLKERDMGKYEKVSFTDLDWEKFWGYDITNEYTELESMRSVYERVSNFLDEIKEKNANALIVTHGGISRAIYWYFNGFDNSLFTCENCKIYEYTIKK